MKYYEKKVLIALLELASGEFSNHGCNDFDMREMLPNISDRQLFARTVAVQDGELEAYQNDVLRGFDFSFDNDAGLLSYFAARITKEVAETRSKLYAALERGLRALYDEDKHRALSTVARILGYEMQEDSWVDEIVMPLPEDEIGQHLYRGLQVRNTSEKQRALQSIAVYEGFEISWE